MALLEASGIGKNFGETKVLKDISLTLEQGEALAIIGSSGSGKTTLLRCLNFLERPDTGVIRVNGETMWDAADPATQRESEVRKKRLHFGLVFQNFNLFPQYTALENVMLAGELLAKEQPDYKANKKAIHAQLEAQAAIEREALMTRFRVASNIFALLMLAALAYGLLLRPIDTPPKAYTAPDVRQDTGAAQTALSADSKDGWKLGGYLGVDCVRTQDGLVYAAAYNGAAMKKRQSDLVRTDGGHTAAILSVEGELTSFAFDADGDLWLTVVTPSGGALCRARHDSWGTSVEQVVTQIDGAPLGVLSAVETGPDGKVYFAVSTEAAAKNGPESALRTELIAHTGTGCVYVYDPSARTVEQVLGGVAGAAGLALSEDGRTLYVSDLGNRCIWSVDADARELTAGGKNCGSFVSGLPGYPGALALDEDGTLYISYRWTRSGWLEKHADSTLLRGIALRAGENIQKKLFKLPADAPCAEAVDTADGSWKQTFSGRELDGCTAVCPAGSKVYFGAAGIRRTRYTIPAALTADLAAFIAAAWAVRLCFGGE